MKLNYSLSMWGYEGYNWPETLDEAIAEAHKSGYGVEIWPSWKGEKDLFAAENRERLVRLIRGVPSSLHGGHVGTLEEHKVQIEAARDTRSTVIAVHADSLDISSDGDYGLARDVVDYAGENGVTIALENADVPGMLERLTRALESVDGLMACLDVGHVYGDHLHKMQEYLARLGGRIAHLHLQDVYFVPGAKRAKGDSHRPPGQCDIPLADWQALLSTLDKTNYNGFAVLEVRPFTLVEIASQTSEFLRSIGPSD